MGVFMSIAANNASGIPMNYCTCRDICADSLTHYKINRFEVGEISAKRYSAAKSRKKMDLCGFFVVISNKQPCFTKRTRLCLKKLETQRD